MNQLKAGVFLSYVIIAINSIVGIAYTPFMLRMMGQSEYGLYSLVASVIAYLTVLDLGFGNAIIRYTAKYRAEGKLNEQYEMFGMFIRLYIGIGLIAFLIGLGLFFNVDRMFSDTMTTVELYKMRVMMLLMSFNLAFTFPLSIFGSIISAYENFVFQKLVNIVRILLNPLVMIVLLLMGYKAIAMVVVTTLFNLTTLLINCWYCYRKLHIKVIFKQFNWKLMKEISTYSFWIFLIAIMDRVYWSTGQFILGIYRGAAVVAIYAVAIQLKSMFYMFSTAISGVFLPKVTAMVTKGASDEEVSNLFIKTGRIQYIIMIYILSGFILFGRQFIHFWAGDNYDESYLITLLLFIPTLIPLIQNLGITILQARNQLKFRSLLVFVVSILSLFVAIPMAQKYGGIGCAIATSLAVLIGHGICLNIYYQKKINLDISRFWSEIAKMTVVPVCVVALSYIALHYIPINSLIQFIVLIIAFTILYIPLFWVFSMNQYERTLFQKPVVMVIGKIRRK